MTLCIALIRTKKREESLYMIADSRFTGGDCFDGCPKLFPLGRGDCALACAGATEFSYPIVDHIQRSIALNIKSFTRALDFCDLCHVVVDITNRCLMDVMEAYVDEGRGPDFQMIFAGYSVIKGKFDIRVIEYDKRANKMFAHKTRFFNMKPFAIIGDHDEGANYVSQYKADMFRALEGLNVIDMEPLDVLMDYINNGEIRSIGGHPQMLKITKFLQTLPFGFYHDKGDGDYDLSYFGRNLLKYETFPYPIYDLDTKEQFYMKGIVEKLRREHEETEPLRAFERRMEL